MTYVYNVEIAQTLELPISLWRKWSLRSRGEVEVMEYGHSTYRDGDADCVEIEDESLVRGLPR